MSGGSGNEFGVKKLFEDLDARKEKEKRLKKQQRNRETGYFMAALGLALLGGLCGGVIFFLFRYFSSVFSVLFLILNGIGASVFYYELMKPERKRKLHIIPVVLGDVLSVFITLAAVYLLIPDYVEDRITMGYSVWKALGNYIFGGMINIQIWVMGILLSAVGIAAGWLVCRGIGRKRKK